jgi:hypothetical protein
MLCTLQKNALNCGGFFHYLRRFLTSAECFAGFFKTPAYTNPTNYLREFLATAGIHIKNLRNIGVLFAGVFNLLRYGDFFFPFLCCFVGVFNLL